MVWFCIRINEKNNYKPYRYFTLFQKFHMTDLVVKDSLGNILEKGDAAFLTQDLPVQGMKPFKR